MIHDAWQTAASFVVGLVTGIVVGIVLNEERDLLCYTILVRALQSA